jgi:hypothetical protein
MAVTFVNRTLTEELRKSGASVTQKEDQAWRNFLNPRTTPEKGYYRLRLLFFADDTNTRTIPFIEKYTHNVYEHDKDGKLTGVDYVTCPTTPYLNIENAWKKCPCCQYADAQYQLATSSEWKNKTATAGHRKMRRAFVAFLPVLVINDPNVPANSGRVMMFNIRDRKAYEELTNVIKMAERSTCVFNGTQAIDLAVVIRDMPNLDKAGNERINKNTGEAYTHREFTWKFSDKPYNVEIPVDQVEGLGFDSSMYNYSTNEELNAFLTKHTISADIPEDDLQIDLSPSTPAVAAPKPTDIPDTVGTEALPATTPEEIDMGFSVGEDVALEPVADVELAADIDFDLAGTDEPQAKEKLDIVSGDVNLDDVLSEFADLEDLEEIAL